MMDIWDTIAPLTLGSGAKAARHVWWRPRETDKMQPTLELDFHRSETSPISFACGCTKDSFEATNILGSDCDLPEHRELVSSSPPNTVVVTKPPSSDPFDSIFDLLCQKDALHSPQSLPPPPMASDDHSSPPPSPEESAAMPGVFRQKYTVKAVIPARDQRPRSKRILRGRTGAAARRQRWSQRHQRSRPSSSKKQPQPRNKGLPVTYSPYKRGPSILRRRGSPGKKQPSPALSSGQLGPSPADTDSSSDRGSIWSYGSLYLQRRATFYPSPHLPLQMHFPTDSCLLRTQSRLSPVHDLIDKPRQLYATMHAQIREVLDGSSWGPSAWTVGALDRLGHTLVAGLPELYLATRRLPFLEKIRGIWTIALAPTQPFPFDLIFKWWFLPKTQQWLQWWAPTWQARLTPMPKSVWIVQTINSLAACRHLRTPTKDKIVTHRFMRLTSTDDCYWLCVPLEREASIDLGTWTNNGHPLATGQSPLPPPLGRVLVVPDSHRLRIRDTDISATTDIQPGIVICELNAQDRDLHALLDTYTLQEAYAGRPWLCRSGTIWCIEEYVTDGTYVSPQPLLVFWPIHDLGRKQ